ncbi:MAG TPA: hypothetical protein VEH04_12710 [Verrucomicrobiae bacterium]|nr:hypothetical protein [Verrucomicrobiae bacterium]
MKRAIRNLIRFVAVALVVIGCLLCTLEFMRQRAGDADAAASKWIPGGALLVAGVICFAISARVAEYFSDDDEDDGSIEIPPET